MIEKNMTFRREELEKLSTLELDTILREELDSDAPERETVLFVLGILEERDPTDSENRLEGAEAAWERLLNRPQQVLPKRQRKPAKWIGAVAAMLTIVLLMTVPQSVGAENIFQIIGRWTRDIFSLSDGTEKPSQDEYVFQTEHEGLQQLYDAVVALGITDPVVPTWLPENYALSELKTITETNKIFTIFHYGTKYVQISVGNNGSDGAYKYPKDDDNVENIELMGQKYYIIPNDETWRAVWITDNGVECFIITNDAEEVLKMIIKSIHGRLNV